MFFGCTFIGNEAATEGGAVSFGGDVFGSILNYVFWGNRSGGAGGAVYAMGEIDPLLFNVLGRIQIAQSTFVGNVAGSGAGAIHLDTISRQISNSILWGNGPVELAIENGHHSGGDPFFENFVRDSIIQGGFEGEGIIDADPLFFDPDSGLFQLQLGSPAIDAGTETGASETDIRGVARPLGGGVDMGAYEFVGALPPVDLLDLEPVSGSVVGGTGVSVLASLAAIEAVYELYAADLAGFYAVAFGEVLVPVDSVSLDTGAIEVTAPAQSFTEDTVVDVTLIQAEDPSNIFTLTDAYTYLVDVQTEGDGEDPGPGGGEGETAPDGEGQFTDGDGEGMSFDGDGEALEGDGEGDLPNGGGDGESMDGDGELTVGGQPAGGSGEPLGGEGEPTTEGEGAPNTEGRPPIVICAPSHSPTPKRPGASADILALALVACVLGAASPHEKVRKN